MTNYKQELTARVSERIDQWLAELKSKHPDLRLTRQWKLEFPRGFNPGQQQIPITTGSAEGRYLIGEVKFYVPDDLELDLEALELVLKDEPFQPAATGKPTPPPIDDALTRLDNMVAGMNQFLMQLDWPENPGPSPLLNDQSEKHLKRVSPSSNQPRTSRRIAVNTSNGNLETIKQRLLSSAHLPDWFKTIRSADIRDELLQQLAQALAHYERQSGHTIELEEFFEKYTQLLIKQDKLYPYCKYKSKPIVLDENGHCDEQYCSKKPYVGSCDYITWRFGKI